MGRESFSEVRDGRVSLLEDRDGSGGPPSGQGRVWRPSEVRDGLVGLSGVLDGTHEGLGRPPVGLKVPP